jgi:Cu(I)/Ag(I) efflux system membrane protein CusA/SilA
VAIVCIVFLFHFRSALVGIFTLPVGVLISFIIMHGQGINANIMSLGGIAIAIGAMVDGAIVMIENAHKHIEHDGGKKPHWELITDAAKEVGPALFFSLLIIAVSFLPVFTLEAQEGRLFRPLAYTKTYAMLGAALLAITIVPILMGYLIRGKSSPKTKTRSIVSSSGFTTPSSRWCWEEGHCAGCRGGDSGRHLDPDQTHGVGVHAAPERG